MNASPAWHIVARRPDASIVVVQATAAGEEIDRLELTPDAFASFVSERPDGDRWVWNDTPRWYPALLDVGVRVARCHDLRLTHAILSASDLVSDSRPLRAATSWIAPASASATVDDALFVFDDGSPRLPEHPEEVLAEFIRQQNALASAHDPDRLRLLVAAESAGALIAEELHAAGVPWDADTHDGILTSSLGPRPSTGSLPARVEEAADRVRDALGDPSASLDSQPKLLRALHRAGVPARSTSRWELAEYDHPVIAPLLAYKKLSRLLSANGWSWLDEWASDGRFRPVYVPGGVVTGRWASSGGGALQLPRLLRPAVRADPGWTLVVADVAQLEPRVLAAMSRDTRLADAARGADLYDGIVSEGVVGTRQEAKIAVLGAMYGATTGDSGRLVPALRRAYPRAMGYVDDAARVGEAGGRVSTWLGRTSPDPSERWRAVQAEASDVDAAAGSDTAARRSARDRGRFTRNFVVQGTAAEWALAWLADLRGRLWEMEPTTGPPATGSGRVFARRPHLAFFLHDEIIVHTPVADADRVATAVAESAARASALLFGGFPLDFPLDLRVTDDAAKD
jgi:DNA polymerase-1